MYLSLYNMRVCMLKYRLFVVAGFPWSSQERAQCRVHAACLRMVGSRERDCEEHLSHLASRRALFQPCPDCCHCWESLFTAARGGRNTAYTDFRRWFLGNCGALLHGKLLHIYFQIFYCVQKYHGMLLVWQQLLKKEFLKKLYSINNLHYYYSYYRYYYFIVSLSFYILRTPKSTIV